MFIYCIWYVTTNCNSRCNYCSIWRDPKYRCEMSPLAERLNMLYQLKRLGVFAIDFTGGEPLLYKGLPTLIRYAHRMGFFTSLVNNGTLYRKYADELKGNVNLLAFSLDSVDRETHDEIRGIKCYDDVLKSIIHARKLGETVMIKKTVVNGGLDTIPPMIKLAQRYGVILELNILYSYFGNEQLTKEEMKRVLKWHSHPNVRMNRDIIKFMLDNGNNVNRPKCKIGKWILVIAPNNDLCFPCMHHVQETIPLIDLNIKKTLRSQRVRNLIEKVGKYDFCHRCAIPCYFEPIFVTKLDKYFLYWIKTQFGYLRKQIVLSLKKMWR